MPGSMMQGQGRKIIVSKMPGCNKQEKEKGKGWADPPQQGVQHHYSKIVAEKTEQGMFTSGTLLLLPEKKVIECAMRNTRCSHSNGQQNQLGAAAEPSNGLLQKGQEYGRQQVRQVCVQVLAHNNRKKETGLERPVGMAIILSLKLRFDVPGRLHQYR